MPLHEAAIEGTIVGKWFIFSLDLCCGCLQKRIKTFMNSHADNRSEIRATRIDERNEDTERKPNGGIEVNASVVS